MFEARICGYKDVGIGVRGGGGKGGRGREKEGRGNGKRMMTTRMREFGKIT